MRRFHFVAFLVTATGSIDLQAAPAPTVQQVLRLRPTQTRVDYDTPTPAAQASCKVEVIREHRASGWILRDTKGRLYRKFMDLNNDNVVDLWSYYKDGVEVYRDIDSNFNGRSDQCRWLNSGGTRWGIDRNEDGKIDSYRSISPEEVTREVVRAVQARDFSMLEPLLVGRDDVKFLGARLKRDHNEVRRSATTRFAELVRTMSHWNSKSSWVRFDGAVPQVIPGSNPDGQSDVTVYTNAVAVVQSGEKIDLLQFAELVRVRGTWKFVDLPRAVKDGAELAGVPGIQPAAETLTTEPQSPRDRQMQELIAGLQSLDEELTAKKIAQEAYQVRRSELVEKVARLAETDQERTDWLKQAVDGLVSVLQTTDSKPAARRLARLVETAKKGDKIISYIEFRKISADYSRRVQRPDADFAAEQEKWLGRLKDFVTEYSAAAEAPDALSQLAVGHEFSGKVDDARKYYQTLATQHAATVSGRRAKGALRRLGLKGTEIRLAGTSLRNNRVDLRQLQGKVLLVTYWATWCGPCKSELPKLIELHKKYRQKGFEVVAISLDNDKREVSEFVRRQRLPWLILHENGGMDSPLAAQYGIISLPYHFLVGKDGKVVNPNVQMTQLESELSKILK